MGVFGECGRRVVEHPARHRCSLAPEVLQLASEGLHLAPVRVAPGRGGLRPARGDPFWYPMDAAWRILPSTSPRTSRGSHARDRSEPDASLMASLAVRKVPDVDEGVELRGWSFYFHGTTILKLLARSWARVSENPRCHAGRVSLRPVPLSRGDCPVERAAPDCGGGGPATSFSKIVSEAAALEFFSHCWLSSQI